MRLARFGVEGFVDLDVVSDGAEPSDGADGETLLLRCVEGHGQAVIGLVEADDGDEAGALQNAVGFGIAAAGEDFPGVLVATQVRERSARAAWGSFLTGQRARRAPGGTGAAAARRGGGVGRAGVAGAVGRAATVATRSCWMPCRRRAINSSWCALPWA